jgi:dihydrofolate reductase
VKSRKALLFIAMSLDGYIADETGGIGFLNLAEMEGEDYGYGAFALTTDTIILGRKSWDTVLSLNIPQLYAEKKVYVISQSRQGKSGNAEYFGGDLPEFVRSLKAQDGLDLFIDGGSQVIHTLMKQKLIDRMVISIIPILLGGGVPLFRPGFPMQHLKLISSRDFTSGLVQLEYEIISLI